MHLMLKAIVWGMGLTFIGFSVGCESSVVISENGCIDQDGDFRGEHCELGSDCNDGNADLYQLFHAYADSDTDSYGTGVQVEVCSGAHLPSNYSTVTGDCNDHDRSIHPGQNELCADGIDNNCDGFTDVYGDGSECSNIDSDSDTDSDTEQCFNRLDDDADLAIDEEDIDCYSDGTIYYISTAGNDSWSGLAPVWNGIDGPKQTIEAAESVVNGAESGDKILFRRGDTFTRSGNGLFVSVAGTASKNIVIGAYGNGDKPVFDIDGASTRGIFIRGNYSAESATQYIRIENIKITTSSAPGSRGSGITIVETSRPYLPHHITIRNCTIEGLMSGMGLQHSSDIIVEDCLIQDNYGIEPESGHTQGMYATADNLTIRNNVFVNNGKTNCDGGEAHCWFDHQIYLSHNDTMLVENNVFRDAWDGIKLRGVANATIRNNKVYNMKLMGIQFGGDADSGDPAENIIIENNEVYNCLNGMSVQEQSGYSGDAVIDGVIIRNNIFHTVWNSGAAGGTAGFITIRDMHTSITGFKIYNNIIYNIEYKRNLSVEEASSALEIDIKNNIFGRATSDAAIVRFINGAEATVAMDYNVYDLPGSGVFFDVDGTEYASFATFLSAYPNLEANGKSGSANLLDPVHNDFHPTATSTLLIDQGADATGIVDFDFEGTSRPQNLVWDIGPYEY